MHTWIIYTYSTCIYNPTSVFCMYLLFILDFLILRNENNNNNPLEHHPCTFGYWP